MRIIIAHDFTQHSFAGSSYYLAHHLAAQGHTVLFFSVRPALPAQKNISYQHALTVIGWPQKRPTGLPSFLYFLHHLKKFKPNVIIAHFGAQNVTSLANFLFGNAKCVVYYHSLLSQLRQDYQASALRFKLLVFRKRLMFRLAHTICCPSQYAAKDLMANYQIKASKVKVVYNAIDLGSEAIAPQRPPIIFGTLSRLTPTKGIMELIEAFKLYTASLDMPSSVVLKIAGGGLLETQVKLATAECPHIEFVGALPHSEVASYMQSLHFFVCPSLIDNLPTTCLEALRAGVPVLATATGGIPEIIADQQTGILFTNTQPATIKDAITEAVHLFSSPNHYQQMRHRCLIHFQEKFSIESYLRNMLALLQELVSLQGQ
ncbi:MAG TPA: glycosyltransferase family 4 protein [Phnomibacter sp.]|nr:glycosyltransferase family 4 protein [Phnomibacter sp.]